MYSRLMLFCETRIIQLCQWKITGINFENETDSWNDHQAQMMKVYGTNMLHLNYTSLYFHFVFFREGLKMEIKNGICHEGREGGSRVPLTYFEKMNFSKPFWIIHWVSKRVLHIVWALYYIRVAVEVTMNMAEYTSSWQSAAGAAEVNNYKKT